MAQKYRVIKKFASAHIYYREQFTNKIAVADQSCVDREGNILPPIYQDDMSQGILYINFDKINDWELKVQKMGIPTYYLPLTNDSGRTSCTLITKKELTWLKEYF
jgi:hypothetical protein